MKRSLLAPTFFSLFSSDGRSLNPLHRPWEQGWATKDSALRNISNDELVLSSKSNKVLDVGVIVRVSRLPHSVESGLFCERIASILEKGSLKKQP